MNKIKAKEIREIIEALDSGSTLIFQDNRLSDSGSTSLRKLDNDVYGEHSFGTGWSDQIEEKRSRKELEKMLQKVHIRFLREAACY